MIRVGEVEDAFIMNTALARKRVRVVQLLSIGLLALLLGFMGGFYVQSSCHFFSADVEVGQNAQVFNLHYGMWKYTPMDSVFQGYSYCYQYDTQYTNDAPMIPRWTSCIALLLGGYSIGVLWFYLIMGKASQGTWRFAVLTAAVAGCLQLSTLLVFIGDVCQREECKLGPAGILSVVVGSVWYILAFEMHYNMPMTAWVTEVQDALEHEEGGLVGNLEMADFKHGAKAYVKRIVPGSKEYQYPTLNQIQKHNARPVGEKMLERDMSPGTYRPPIV
jgi:hypothetical protein